MSTAVVTNNTGRQRYEAVARSSNLAGFGDYQETSELVVLTHTEVGPVDRDPGSPRRCPGTHGSARRGRCRRDVPGLRAEQLRGRRELLRRRRREPDVTGHVVGPARPTETFSRTARKSTVNIPDGTAERKV